ncbi:MAG: hypothetical protein QF437_13475 [Planctomycetota bacterium]|nr:hypothetical protein [Planctomycetota bacterium]
MKQVYLLVLTVTLPLLAERPHAHIGANGNLIVNGRAVFPIEIYSARWDEDFAITKACGFNTVIEFGQSIEDRAERFGMLLIDPNWMGRDNTIEQVAAKAEKYRNKMAVIAYNLNDEPDLRPESGVSPADLERIAGFFRKKAPGRMLSVTCSGGAGGIRLWPDYARLVDIFRIDPYPVIGGAPLSLVTDRLEAARRAAGPGKPVWVVLQAWYMGDASKFPSARQDRCMTYLALAGGAKAISHFDFNLEVWSKFPEFWTGLIQNNRELRLLTPPLLEGAPLPVKSSEQDIKVAALLWKRSVVVLIANQSAQELDASVEITGKFKARNSMPTILFKERKAAEDLIPISLSNEADGISFDVVLPGHGVHALQIPVSRWYQKVDRYPLSESELLPNKGIISLERSRNWLRIKNTTNSKQFALLDWKSRSPEIIETDIAFRPMRVVAPGLCGGKLAFNTRPQTVYEIGRRPAEFDPFGEVRAFKRLRLDIEFSAPYILEGFGLPSQRYRCFQGAVIPIHIMWRSDRRIKHADVSVKVIEHAWQPKLTYRSKGGVPLPKRGQSVFDVIAPQPKRWDRDETLTVKISRGRHSVIRRMRFRYQRPLELAFEWQVDETGLTSGLGTASLKSNFYGYVFDDLRLKILQKTDGWETRITKKDKRQFGLSAKPPKTGTGDGKVHRFKMEVTASGKVSRYRMGVTASGIPPTSFDLPGLLLSGGKMYVAQDGQRRVRVPRIPAPLIDGKIDMTEWKQASSLIGFLGLGVATFSGRQPRAWIAHDKKTLFVAAHLPGKSIRVRKAEHDKVDWSDDLFELYLDADPSPTFHCIVANAEGAVSDFIINPAMARGQRLNLRWNSQAVVKTIRDDSGWSIELSVPLGTFSGEPLGAKREWRFNIRTPHGVAPRYAEIFSFSSQWMPIPSEMAHMLFD